MEKNEFKRIIKELLISNGFKLHEKSFYFMKTDLILVFQLQKSSYSNGFYLNYGFYIVDNKDESIFPKITDCDAFGRLIIKKNNNISDIIDFEVLNKNEIESYFNEFFDEKIKPVIEIGIEKYFEMNPKAIYTASLKAKHKLGLE